MFKGPGNILLAPAWKPEISGFLPGSVAKGMLPYACPADLGRGHIRYALPDDPRL